MQELRSAQQEWHGCPGRYRATITVAVPLIALLAKGGAVPLGGTEKALLHVFLVLVIDDLVILASAVPGAGIGATYIRLRIGAHLRHVQAI